MKLDLMTRKRITKEVSKRYKKTSKKEKGRILDEFCALSGYNRSYAAWVLRRGASPKEKDSDILKKTRYIFLKNPENLTDK